MRIPALILAAIGLLAVEAHANDSLKIERADIRSINKGRLNLSLGLYSRSGRGKHRVEVYYVRGSERVRLAGRDATFSGARGGFESGVAVDLGRRNLKKARLEVVVPGCTNKKNCVRKIALSKTSNLMFDGGERIERRGTSSLLQFKIKNNGLSKSSKCKLSMTVAGKPHGKTQMIPGLAPSKSHQASIRYPKSLKGKKFEARLKCRDLIKKDNVRRGKLK